MVLPVLAFLNLGPSELAIILVLFLLLFGVDKVPEMARSLGKAKAELDRAQTQVTEAFKSEEERATDSLLGAERAREAAIARGGLPDEKLLTEAALLGIDTLDMSEDDVRAEIARRAAE